MQQQSRVLPPVRQRHARAGIEDYQRGPHKRESNPRPNLYLYPSLRFDVYFYPKPCCDGDWSSDEWYFSHRAGHFYSIKDGYENGRADRG